MFGFFRIGREIVKKNDFFVNHEIFFSLSQTTDHDYRKV